MGLGRRAKRIALLGQRRDDQRAEQEAKKPIRFYLDSGCPADNCAVTDELADVLKNKGYDYVRIKEDAASHDWVFRKKRLPGLLTHFRDKQTVCD